MHQQKSVRHLPDTMGFPYALLIILAMLLFLSPGIYGRNPDTLTLEKGMILISSPDFFVTQIPGEVRIALKPFDDLANDSVSLHVMGEHLYLSANNSETVFPITFDKASELKVIIGKEVYTRVITPVPLWLSILPPLIAIVLALLVKEVFSALFIGILAGTTILFFYQQHNLFESVFLGLLSIIDTYILQSVLDSGHVSIILFSMLIGGMVSIITANGGMQGIVNYLSKFASNARNGQLVTWLMGITLFFDDYANTLVVGNTMRPVTDKLRISREKLAYIVDSTAAPIAAIAFVTTWIGAELSYIQDGIDTLPIDESPYNIFISSLQYSFYPLYTLVFVAMLIWSGKDFGPMFKAEVRTRKHGIESAGEEERVPEEKQVFKPSAARWYNAAIPVMIVVFGTIAGLFYTGWDQTIWQNSDITFSAKLSTTIGNSDSYLALLWSSLGGVLVAVGLTLSQRILNLKDTMESLIEGLKSMLTAIMILILAWSIALITEHMHTAEFISISVSEMNLSPVVIPTITFILGALVAFSTGSSWGTMAILYPLILPASWLLGDLHGLPYAENIEIFYNVVASVLAGSVLGDHCSPISDTTILSSLSSSCNHIEHVRTQLPYALIVGFFAIIGGVLPAAYGIPFYILFPLTILIMFFTIKGLGKKLPA